MTEWNEYKLGDLAEITSSKRIFFSDYVSDGVPFYRSKEIIEKSLGASISTRLFITEEKYNEIRNKYGAPNNGDILISAVGERAGIPYYVNGDGKFYFKDGNLIWFRNIRENVSPNYLVHFFNSNVGQRSLESTMIGSAQKALTIIGLKHLEISLPPFEEQTAIAEVLSSLDDKIDLLHRQNKTLEQLGETLFRQWFVEEAEEGWEEKELGHLLDFIVDNRGKTAPTCNYGIPLIATNCVKNDNIFPVYEKVRYVSMETYNNWFRAHLEPGDVLFVNKGTPGCVNLVPNPVDFCIAQDMIALRPNKQIASNYYIFLLLRSDSFQADIQNRSVGTTIPHLKKTDLIRMKIMIPNSSLLNKFNEIVEPKFTKMNNNNQQIRTLIQLRDTLLPKLMSGEVRVKI